MAIQSNRLVVRPTTERGDAKVSCVEIVNEIPPNAYVTKDENNTLVQVFQDPQYEGQVKVYVDGSLVQMYVVVDMSGTLTWKVVKITTGYVNTDTGLPYSSL